MLVKKQSYRNSHTFHGNANWYNCIGKQLATSSTTDGTYSLGPNNCPSRFIFHMNVYTCAPEDMNKNLYQHCL